MMLTKFELFSGTKITPLSINIPSLAKSGDIFPLVMAYYTPFSSFNAEYIRSISTALHGSFV